MDTQTIREILENIIAEGHGDSTIMLKVGDRFIVPNQLKTVDIEGNKIVVISQEEFSEEEELLCEIDKMTDAKGYVKFNNEDTNED